MHHFITFLISNIQIFLFHIQAFKFNGSNTFFSIHLYTNVRWQIITSTVTSHVILPSRTFHHWPSHDAATSLLKPPTFSKTNSIRLVETFLLSKSESVDLLIHCVPINHWKYHWIISAPFNLHVKKATYDRMIKLYSSDNLIDCWQSKFKCFFCYFRPHSARILAEWISGKALKKSGFPLDRI